MNRALAAAALLSLLAACDEPAPRKPPPPAPSHMPPAVAAEAVGAGREALAPIEWREKRQAFFYKGQPLKTARLWTFDGSTDGFVLSGGTTTPLEDGGARLQNDLFDPVLLSPKALALDGSRYPLVLVRLTRAKASLTPGWDGTLFYATAGHGMSQNFSASPALGGDPQVGETRILVYDMAHPTRGGADWSTSLIDQIRIDTDDQPGGEFVLRQVAIAENPDPAGLPPKPEP